MSASEFEVDVLKMKTHILKVHIHCLGCKQKVKKLLRKIEGVYSVNIDLEQQKVTVSGIVDSSALIKKLAKSRKYAELWSQVSNSEEANMINDMNHQGQIMFKGLVKDLGRHKSYPILGHEYGTQADPLWDSDQYHLFNQQQSMGIEENLNSDAEDDLLLGWENQQLLASNDGNNSMNSNYSVTDGGFHGNGIDGPPSGYRANYHPSMAMFPNKLSYPCQCYSSPMIIGAEDRMMSPNMIKHDGGYMYQPQMMMKNHTSGLFPRVCNYYKYY